MKPCSKCSEIKEEDLFPVLRRRNSDGVFKYWRASECKACRAVRHKAYNIKKYYHNNPLEFFDHTPHKELTFKWKGVRAYPVVSLIGSKECQSSF